MLPVRGLTLQETCVLLVPLTVAVNCCVWPALKLVDVGLMLNVGFAVTDGFSVTVAVAKTVASATSVAFTVTICVLLTLPGAV
jgi:hypothetical protein